MKRNRTIFYSALIAVCFFYTGSAYMSQSYRLMAWYDPLTVDLITSVGNYLFQAAGIALFSLGLRKAPSVFGKRRLFAVLLAAGVFFMAVTQLSENAAAVCGAGYVFNLLIGTYFGYYLTMLAQYVPPRRMGTAFGAAYAAASVGTYLLSRIRGGEFLVSRAVTAVYCILAAAVIALVLAADDIGPAACAERLAGKASEHANERIPDCAQEQPALFRYLIPVIALMTVISVIGSELFYSLPVAESVNWTQIRAFYAVGLILAGLILDRRRLIGEIIVIGTLVYPLIFSALVGEGVTGMAAMTFSYIFRGFLTIYYVVSFTEPCASDPARLPTAPLGLLTSRAVEGILSLLLLLAPVPPAAKLIAGAVCFLPLLVVFVLMQLAKRPAAPPSFEQRLAAFSDRYLLTAREAEILTCLREGMTDTEIAEKLFISKTTVRYHISNLLKKTETSSRTEVVRALEQAGR